MSNNSTIPRKSLSDLFIKLNDRLFENKKLMFLFFLVAIVFLKWPFIANPPIWDEAFSIFPAADFLLENGFDYKLLFAQGTYHQGAPAAHALSLLTIYVAFILKITGGGIKAWIILRATQWLIGAAIGLVLTILYADLFDKSVSLLLSLLTLCFPMVLSQLGFMYLEIPTLFFSLIAFYFLYKNSHGLSSFFLFIACTIKPSALIALMSMSLFILLSTTSPLKEKIKKITYYLISVVPYCLLVIMNSPLSQSNSDSAKLFSFDFFKNLYYANLSIFQNHIIHIPDFTLLFFLSFFVSVILLGYSLIKKQKLNSLVLFNSLHIVCFVFFFFILFASINSLSKNSVDVFFLIRYFVFVAPSVFFTLYYATEHYLKNKKILISLLVTALLYSFANKGGMLYPALPVQSIALAERSEEYLDSYMVTRDCLEFLEQEINEDIPIYVALPDYFLAKYSVSEYVSKPLKNVKLVSELYMHKELPKCFVLVHSYPFLGGNMILGLCHYYASAQNEYETKFIGYFEKNFFNAKVIQVCLKEQSEH